jgi:hypothetical protein
MFRSKEAATDELHTAAPGAQGSLVSSHLVGIGIFDDNNLRLRLYYHRLVIVRTLVCLDHHFLHIRLLLVTHLIVHLSIYPKYYIKTSTAP